MNSGNNIILIGMPASGKSTVGVILAKILGMDFIDTDIVIQQREGFRLNEIIDKYGIDEFLKREEQIILDIKVSNTIISTGGSAVYSESGMKHLSRSSKVIYLEVGLEEMKNRLQDIKERGVVLRTGENIDEMYETRSKLYERYADVTVTEAGNSIDNTVEKVIKCIVATNEYT